MVIVDGDWVRLKSPTRFRLAGTKTYAEVFAADDWIDNRYFQPAIRISVSNHSPKDQISYRFNSRALRDAALAELRESFTDNAKRRAILDRLWASSLL